MALGYLGEDPGFHRSFQAVSTFSPGLLCKGSVVYATGDYGKLTSQGELLLLGRRDSQIKINGQRVDLSEIRRILSTFPIAHFVVPVKDPAGRTRLYCPVSESKSYIQSAPTVVQDGGLIKKLYHACREFLPLYMIPRFVVISAMPHNASGKVDERILSQLLQDHFHTRLNETTSFAIHSPLGSEEELQNELAGIVAARFSGNVPDVDEDLRCFGMTSLDMMLFVKDVKANLGVSLPLQHILLIPNMRSISQALAGAKSDLEVTPDLQKTLVHAPHYAVPEEQVDPAERPGASWTEMSAGQEMLYAAQQVLGNHAYNCNFVLHINGVSIDARKMISALRIVCARHETLRSTYHHDLAELSGEHPQFDSQVCRQRVHVQHELNPMCQFVDLEPSSEGGNESSIMQFIADSAASTFDLSQDSPVRMTIYQLNPKQQGCFIHFNIHHIAIDEWGFRNMCRELETIYQAPRLNDTVLLTDPPQYRDYAKLFQPLRAYGDNSEEIRWWLNAIDAEMTEPLLTELRLRGLSQVSTAPRNASSLVYAHKFDPQQIRYFEVRVCHGVTPFIGWLALCQLVLTRILQRTKFTMTIPVTGRGMDQSFHDIIGYCLNTLVLPVDVATDSTFELLLSSTQRVFDTCSEHLLPMELILKHLQQHRSRAGMDHRCKPEVMFIYHDPVATPLSSDPEPGFLQNAETVRLPSVGTQFDFVIRYLNRNSEAPVMEFEYCQELFDREVVEMIARSFEETLSTLVSGGTDILYTKINVLSAVDEALIKSWSTPSPLSETMESLWIRGPGLRLHELVERSALRFPQATAIVTASGISVTYAELLGRARAFSRRLQVQGLKGGEAVMLFLTRSVELVVAQLAVLLVGAAFVIVDPQQKQAINEEKVRISRPVAVVVDSFTAQIFFSLQPEPRVQVVRISDAANHTIAPGHLNPSEGEDAYFCFSSGSTGNAKYFVVSHAAAAASIMCHIEQFELSVGDRVGMVSSITFDAFILETFAALAASSTLCIASQDDTLSNLAQTLRSIEATHLFVTPSLLSLLDGPAQTPSLRFVALLGEATPAALFMLWVNDVDLRNLYGPAEVAMNTHTRRFSPRDDAQRVGQRLGTSLPSISSYVLDRHGNLLPPGCVGNLHIGMRAPDRLGQLSRGYMFPDSANDRYKSHPVFGRLFDTGDRVVYTFDGELNILGREDYQVKIHGVQLDLGDIERTFQQETTRQVAVVRYDDVDGTRSPSQQVTILFLHFQNPSDVVETGMLGTRLSWLFPLSQELYLELSRLRDHGAAKLLEVAMPQYWLPVYFLPRNENEKLDRRALRSWAMEFLSLCDEKVSYASLGRYAPNVWDGARQDGLKRTLIDSWKLVFQVHSDEVDVDTSFLHVAGDSISAIRYTSRLRSRGVVGCTVAGLYKTPTLSQLYEALKPLQSDGMGQTEVPPSFQKSEELKRLVQSETGKLGIPLEAIGQVYLATSMQSLMLLQNEGDPAVYCTQTVLRFNGKLDHEHISAAWQKVVWAHPAMHTTFVRAASADVLSFFALEVEPSTLFQPVRVFPKPVSTRMLDLLLKQDTTRGFPLGGSMFRLMMLSMSKDRCTLVLSCHHASCDGWSLNILVSDLISAYRNALLQPSISFATAVNFNNTRDTQVARAYWKSYLDNYDPAPVALKRSVAGRKSSMAVKRRQMSLIAASTLSEFAHRHEVTTAVILQAAWANVLSNATCAEEVAFGVVVSGRDAQIPGIDRMVGNFLNTIPLRVRFDRRSGCHQVLRHVHDSFVETLEHQHLSSEQICRQIGHTQIFETVVVFEMQDDSLRARAADMMGLLSIEGREFSGVPLTLVLDFVAGGLRVTIKFDEIIFPTWQVDSLLDSYAATLVDIMADGLVMNWGRSSSYSELSFVRDLMARLQEDEEDVSTDPTIVTLWDEAVHNFPQKVAVEEDARAITFLELAKMVDVVCNRLSQAGVCSHEVVPILFDHSAEMIAAMIGVLKSGAAYCPVDADCPDQKLHHILATTMGKVVLCQSHYFARLSRILGASIAIMCVPGGADIEETLLGGVQSVGQAIDAQQPCYVLFTSGSTGSPKACVLSHRAVVNAVLQTSAVTDIKPKTRVLLFASYTFDASVIDIFGSLLNGATLCLTTRTQLLSDLPKVINRRQISHVHLTPIVARILPSVSLTTLKTLVIGGEPMQSMLQKRWADKVSVYDGYGPTECAVQISTSPVTLRSELGAITNVLPGNVAVLLTRQGTIPRVGEVGEVCVAGVQTFSGYLQQSEATSASMRYSAALDCHLFATGDFGWYHGDMNIHLMGRRDSQVKLLGERIDLSEIEEAVFSCNRQRPCAAVVHNNLLYVIIEAGLEQDKTAPDDIRELCRKQLPERLVPQILYWPILPMTVSSKVDRRALERQLRDAQTRQVAAADNVLRSDMERSVALMIATLGGNHLEDATVPLHLSGLNSLDLLHLRSAIVKSHGLELELSELWLTASVRSIAAQIQEMPTDTDRSDRTFDTRPPANTLPASDPQLAIYLAQQKHADSTYNVGRVVSFTDFDGHRLYDSVQAVVEVFDIFKITFEWNEASKSLQTCLHQKASVSIQSQEIGPGDEGISVVRSVCRMDYRTAFDMAGQPLARFRIFTSGSKHCYFYYNIHHILVDEWTTEMLMDAILKQYHGTSWRNAIQVSWGSLTAVWDFQAHKAEALQDWKHQLTGTMPFDTHSWPAGAGDAENRSPGATSLLRLPREDVDLLRKQFELSGLGLFTVLLSAYQALLHQ